MKPSSHVHFVGLEIVAGTQWSRECETGRLAVSHRLTDKLAIRATEEIRNLELRCRSTICSQLHNRRLNSVLELAREVGS